MKRCQTSSSNPWPELFILIFEVTIICLLWELNLNSFFSPRWTYKIYFSSCNFMDVIHGFLISFRRVDRVLFIFHFFIWSYHHHFSSIFYFRYFQHASGEIFVISRALAQFVSINRWAHIVTKQLIQMPKDSDLTITCCLSTEPFYVHMPMMMWVLDHGLLDLM